MRLSVLFGFLFFALPSLGLAQSASPLKFVRNHHQWESGILYRADVPGGFLFIRKGALQYVFYDTQALQDHHVARHTSAGTNAAASLRPDHAPRDLIRAHGFQIDFIGFNPASTVEAIHESPEKRNYFIGKDPARWASHVSAYGELIYKDIYPGIDLRLYVKNDALKYEFLVAPRADASRIRLRYSGADQVRLENEQLLIQTSVNSVTETQPYCYQTLANGNQEIKSGFVLKQSEVGFNFPQGYQKERPLVIDPVLVFSTFSGAGSDNWGHCATYDEEDNMYATGTAWGANFPATNGAFQTRFANVMDVAILKYNPLGTQLLYASFLGGEEADVPHSTIVNSKGELVILGTTSSRQFPVSASAFDRTFNGGSSSGTDDIDYENGSDMFVTCVSADGSQLVASTYLGGNGNDGLRASKSLSIHNYGDHFRGEIITDNNDNVYLASVTNSSDFPLLNATQTARQGTCDAVLVRFNPTLSSLQWSTLFGGNGFDAASAMRVSSNGNVYLSGVTTSTTLPGIQAEALNSTFMGVEDGFVAHFQNDQLMQTTYVGTPQADQVFLMDLDKDDNVYLFGLSRGEYPITAGTYHVTGSRQFIHAIRADLSQTVFSTTFGTSDGALNLTPTAFMVNECNKIYLSGWAGIVNDITDNTTNSTSGLPSTPDALKTTTTGDDFYIMMLEAGATELLYATFFGNDGGQGDHVDGGTSRFNKKGVIYQATCACIGSGFPTTPGAWSRTNRSSNCNNIAFKLDIDALDAAFDIYDAQGNKDVLSGCQPFTARFVNTSIGGRRYEWDLAGLATSSTAGEISYTFTKPGTYTIQLNAFNNLTCKREDSTTRIITVFPMEAKISGDTTICPNSRVRLKASGGITYRWLPTKGLDNPALAEPEASPESTTRYTVTITNENGCSIDTSVVVQVLKTTITLTPDAIICPNSSIQLNATGGKTYRWSPAAGLSDTTIANPVAAPITSTRYTVHITNEFGCSEERNVLVSISSELLHADFLLKDSSVCAPFTARFVNKSVGGTRYQWNLGKLATLDSLGGVTYTFHQAGEYVIRLKAYDACGLSDSISKTIHVFAPTFSAQGDATICLGETVSLRASGGTRYAWSPTTGLDDPTSANPKATPTATTTYSVTITNAETTCSTVESVTVTLAKEAPPAAFDVVISSECDKMATVRFLNNSEKAEYFQWILGNGDTLTAASPGEYTYSIPGTYEVILKAFQGLCQQSTSKQVEIESNIEPVNVITPNGDGVNERFVISAKGSLVALNGYKLEIYNRWGKLMYQSNSYQHDWGGSINNGVYYYLLTSPKGLTCKGWIQVLY